MLSRCLFARRMAGARSFHEVGVLRLLRQSMGPISTIRKQFSTKEFDELRRHLGDTDVYYKAVAVLHELASRLSNEIVAEKDKLVAEKDKSADLLNKKSHLERDLAEAATENLRLKGKLDLRGMLEEIERTISPGRLRKREVQRAELWGSHQNAQKLAPLFDELAICFPDQKGSEKKAVIRTIVEIHDKANAATHEHINLSKNAIHVNGSEFRKHELCVIRALAKHFHFRIHEEA